MKKRIKLVFLIVFVLLLCIRSADAKNYAVLISAGETYEDDAAVNSEYWYDMFLMYKTLIDEGYSHEDIYVLYGNGSDFESIHECYQNSYPVTDFPNYESNIESIFSFLGSIMTEDDFLFVWWMGHGDRLWVSGGWHLSLYIENINVWIWDFELVSHINQIQNYRIRTFSFMTCFSGGIIDDLEGFKSIVFTATDFCPDCLASSDWLCDSWHAELNYYEACAFHWETPCNLCGGVDADIYQNSMISFEEAYLYSDSHMMWSDPQKSDQGSLAPNTYLAQSCFPTGDANSDGVIDIGDVIYLLNYLFIDGPPPDPLVAGDVTCDEEVNIGDVIYLLSYLFSGGPPPGCC
jgi:hypothetical protein